MKCMNKVKQHQFGIATPLLMYILQTKHYTPLINDLPSIDVRRFAKEKSRTGSKLELLNLSSHYINLWSFAKRASIVAGHWLYVSQRASRHDVITKEREYFQDANNLMM